MRNSTVTFDMSNEYGIMNIGKHKVIFDKEDYARLQGCHWQVNDNGMGYLRVRAVSKNSDGICNYRVLSDILGFPRKHTVHLNGNPLDVRKDNLTIRTTQQIRYSAKLCKKSKSGIKGVKFNENTNRWVSTIGYANMNFHLGSYKTKEEAARARILAEDIYCHGHINDNQKFLHNLFTK